MPIDISQVSDPRIASLLQRVDRTAEADRDGTVNAREAAHAVRRMEQNKALREAAIEAFGVVPKSGRELLAFVARPPREEALERILGQTLVTGAIERPSRGRGDAADLGVAVDGTRLTLTPGGRIARDGALPKDLHELSETMLAAAKLVRGLTSALPTLMRRRLFATLADALAVSLRRPRTHDRDQLFASSMTMLAALARLPAADKAAAPLQCEMVDKLLAALAAQPDRAMRTFYLRACAPLTTRFDPAQQAAFAAIATRALPEAPPVDTYTKNRIEPLEVRHVIHPDFWKDDCGFYAKKRGWTEVRRNAKDTEREYEATLPDPSGKKPPLKVHVKLQKGEFDFLSSMGDPNVHAIIYSGHSSLGGNGSEAIDGAPAARGLPKTVMMASCRSKDNVAEFANRFGNKAMLIFTEQPTYSDPECRRTSAFYEMMARGESFAFMRERTRVRVIDEAADNYVYPDEWRSMQHLDLDHDGTIDDAATGTDQLFDVGGHRRALDFTRAVAFINSELFYHWEVAVENKEHPIYGRGYGDHVVAAGPIEDPQSGEIVRVIKKERQRDGKVEAFFEVRYDPADVGRDRDAYAGVVTAQVALALARDKDGKLTAKETMRSILMGAQALEYLAVYADTAPQAMRRYLSAMGLPDVPQEAINEILEGFDAHCNDAQVEAFTTLLEKKHKLDVAAYVAERNRASAGHS